MPVGFGLVVSSRDPLCTTPSCALCKLDRRCKSPKMQPTGQGRERILVCAESPGQDEDEEGVQLIGKSGQLLRKALKRFGIDLDRDCWKTNAVVCRPPNNEKPTDAQLDACRPLLRRTIEELQPEKILLLGGTAVQSFLPMSWGKTNDLGGIGQWVGWRIPDQMFNAWVCPTWHPAFLLRQNEPVLELWWHRHLEEMLALSRRPWPDGRPDYASQVEVIYEPRQAARLLDLIDKPDDVIAFDYETNMLKPDSPQAAIHSCGVCWKGRKTFAYPWVGEAVRATGELLRRKQVRKVGWNVKFEQRWTQRAFGHGAAGWLHDGMIAAHIADNRPGITSAKFQAYVQLGQPIYNREVEPYLQADNSNMPNRIRELPIETVLRYNGMDALVEYLVYEKQRVQMGLDD